MARKKISVIGAGNVGATAAFLIAQKQVGDVVMVDIIDGVPQGKSLDMAQASPIELFDASVTGALDYEATAGSDLVIITSGSPRKPGMTREDLLQTNAKIVGNVTESVVKHSPNCIIVMLTNPLDIMTYHAWKVSGFPPNRVLGQAGVLDSARFRYFIALELGVSVEDVQALVMGGHGDTMVPLPRYTTVAGVPITQLMSPERITALAERTRDGGAEIVNLLKTSGYYAAGAALAQMAEAIIRDKRRILPCAAYCDKEYGVGGYFVGVPCVLGRNGVEKIIEVELSADERKQFDTSVSHVKELVGVAEKFLG